MTHSFSLVGLHHGLKGHKPQNRSLHAVKQRLLPVDGPSDWRLILEERRLFFELFKEPIHQFHLFSKLRQDVVKLAHHL